jgi:hypothetical protein
VKCLYHIRNVSGIYMSAMCIDFSYFYYFSVEFWTSAAFFGFLFFYFIYKTKLEYYNTTNTNLCGWSLIVELKSTSISPDHNYVF